MNKLGKLYRRTGWHTVFSFDDENTSARTYILGATAMQAVVGGLSTGVFYTGFLLGYGINIVNLSILTAIPYLTSLFSLLTPYILDRFPKRRAILSAARILYYLINIVGITVLPKLVSDPQARVMGLILIVFVANSINFLFSGYSPWHMAYITPEVRTAYFSGTTMASNLIGTVVALLTSLVTEGLEAQQQMNLFVAMRMVAFIFAVLDVYFLQKPREPEYLLSQDRPSLLSAFTLPLKNRKFMLTMLLFFIYTMATNLTTSVITTWHLQEVDTGYVFPSTLNVIYPLFVIFTASPWSRFLQRYGNLKSLAMTCTALAVSYIAYCFVDHSNYLWLMAAVRIFQHGIGMIQYYSVSNLIYLNLPKEDQTAFTSFHTIVANLTVFASMSLGTWVVAVMGNGSWQFLGHTMTSVPTLLLAQGVLTWATSGIVLLLRVAAEPVGRRL